MNGHIQTLQIPEDDGLYFDAATVSRTKHKDMPELKEYYALILPTIHKQQQS